MEHASNASGASNRLSAGNDRFKSPPQDVWGGSSFQLEMDPKISASLQSTVLRSIVTIDSTWGGSAAGMETAVVSDEKGLLSPKLSAPTDGLRQDGIAGPTSGCCDGFLDRARQRFRQVSGGRPGSSREMVDQRWPRRATASRNAPSSSAVQPLSLFFANGSRISLYRFEHWSSFLPGIRRAMSCQAGPRLA